MINEINQSKNLLSFIIEIVFLIVFFCVAFKLIFKIINFLFRIRLIY